MKDAIGFGALNFDLIYEVENLDFLKEAGINYEANGEVEGKPEDFRVIQDLLGKFGKLRSESGGGSAANTLHALAKMGFTTGYLGKVGKDSYGDFLLEALKPVDSSQVCRGSESGVCLVLLNNIGERSMLVFPNSNDTITYNEINLDYLKNTRFLHLTSFKSDSPLKVQIRVVEEIHSQVRISFDPGEIYASKGLKEIGSIIERSYIVFLNDKEIRLLLGKSYKEGAKELLGYGPSVIACKMGEKGSFIATRDEEFEIPGEKVKAVDTTGAGDVYNAGFLAGLLLDFSLYNCALFATKAAALSITGYGREKHPGQQFLKDFKSLQGIARNSKE